MDVLMQKIKHMFRKRMSLYFFDILRYKSLSLFMELLPVEDLICYQGFQSHQIYLYSQKVVWLPNDDMIGTIPT